MSPSSSSDKINYLNGLKAGLGVLLSRLTGIVRSQLLAKMLGASGLTDAFFFAFRIPNLLREFWSDGAFSSALMASYFRTEDTERTASEKIKFLVQVGLFFFCMSTLFTVGMWFAAPYLVTSWQPDDERYIYAVRALKIMVFFLTLSVFSSWLMTIFNLSHKNFWAFASSAAYNVVVIVYLVLAGWNKWHETLILHHLPYIVLLGGLGQILVLTVRLHHLISWPDFRTGFVAALSLKVFTVGGRVFWSTLPRVLAQCFYLGSWFVSISVAQTLVPGSITYLTLAQIVVLVPVGILGVAFSLASLPTMAKLAYSNRSQFIQQVNHALSFQSILSLINIIGCSLGSYALANLFFGYDRFHQEDVRQTAILIGSLISVSFFNILNKFLLQACFADQKVWITALTTFSSFLIIFFIIEPLTKWLGLTGIVLSNILTACWEFMMTSLILKNLTSRKTLIYLGFLILFIINTFIQPYFVEYQLLLFQSKINSFLWLCLLGLVLIPSLWFLLVRSQNPQSVILLQRIRKILNTKA